MEAGEFVEWELEVFPIVRLALLLEEGFLGQMSKGCLFAQWGEVGRAFVVSNGNGKILRLLEGEYDYTLKSQVKFLATPNPDSSREQSTGRISWQRNPHPKIRTW